MAAASDGIAQVNTLATQYAFTVWNSASDFLIIFIILAFFFVFAWYVGRGPFIAILLSYYGAYAIYIAFPFMSLLPTAPPLTALLAHAGLYAALGVVFYVILRRVVVSDFLYVGNLGLIALSFFGATYIIAIAYHLFAVYNFYHFTPAIDLLFSSDTYFFWWFSAPAIGLFFLAR